MEFGFISVDLHCPKLRTKDSKLIDSYTKFGYFKKLI